MAVRHYKLHTNLGATDDTIYDLTAGKIRVYSPNDLGFEASNSIWYKDGIGVVGNSSVTVSQLEFKLETFGANRKENYELLREFIQTLSHHQFVTLEYESEIGTYFADVTLAKQTKTEAYGWNGTFSEQIIFDVLTRWYAYERLEFVAVNNGPVLEGISKIYTASGYSYIENTSYTYFGETNVDRLSRWEIEDEVFSIVAHILPKDDLEANEPFGLSFLDVNGNEYSAVVSSSTSVPFMFSINTDVNNEFYVHEMSDGTKLNVFSTLDFQRYRTRFLSRGTMVPINVKSVEIFVKKRINFV